ncbi:MAG: lasso peptide biosynthesis B2 protein [Solirubrobacteraceae bacterium]
MHEPVASRPPRVGWRVIPEAGLAFHLRLLLGAEIIVTYVRTRLRMRGTDVRTLVAASRAGAPPPPGAVPAGAQERWQVAVRLGYAVGRTLGVLPTDSRCLVQSLVLSRLLAVRGIPSTLVIGAHSRPDFAAHAWVEYDGRPVLPRQGFHESRLLEL